MTKRIHVNKVINPMDLVEPKPILTKEQSEKFLKDQTDIIRQLVSERTEILNQLLQLDQNLFLLYRAEIQAGLSVEPHYENWLLARISDVLQQRQIPRREVY